MKVRKAFLVVPAYILAITAVFASVSLLPTAAGVLLASILTLGISTSVSLVHPQLEAAEPEVHIFVWGLVSVVGLIFAQMAIPASSAEPVMILSDGFVLNWYHILFLALQQALYFGIHAIAGDGD